jgi:pimeloyl-ACP methyl ester carboxylesterase
MRRAAVVWWFLADWLYALRWQLRSLRRGAPPEDYRRASGGAVPVVLVPGVYESWRFLQPLTEALHRAGHPVHVITGLGFNSGEIPAMAQAVRRYVDDQGLARVALVGHSKGGLIGKQLLVHANADGRFDRLVAVNSPFSGSTLARFLPLRTLRVFVPGGPLLRDLTAASAVNPMITSVYSAVDPNIPGTSHLPGARNVRIETVGHFRVLSDPRVQAAVLDALRAPAPGGDR